MQFHVVQLVIQYDGSGFAGWQRQPDARTVQGVIENAMERLCGAYVAVLGAGRTDAGVHATGQAAGVRVPARWQQQELMRALNAILPWDVRISSARIMREEFHARYSAISRTYRYLVGTDPDAESPFRSRLELVWHRRLDRSLLDLAAALVVGEHSFRGFAVKGTAPPPDDHRCVVESAAWIDRQGGLSFIIKANRFLHHMVRFLVGTMLDVASGRRSIDVIHHLLIAGDNTEVSAPAPAHALYLERVEYPRELYMAEA